MILDARIADRMPQATFLGLVLINGAVFKNHVLLVGRLEDKRSQAFSHDEKSPTRERIVDIGSYLVVVS